MEHINRLLIAIIGSRLEPIFDPGPSADSLFFRLQSAVVLTDEIADLIGHRQEPHPLFLVESDRKSPKPVPRAALNAPEDLSLGKVLPRLRQLHALLPHESPFRRGAIIHGGAWTIAAPPIDIFGPQTYSFVA